MKKNDELISVDGETVSKDNVVKLLRGSDEIGYCNICRMHSLWFK